MRLPQYYHFGNLAFCLYYNISKTLNSFLTGSLVASEAIYEIDVDENDLFNTKAQYESESHTWVLNGTKAFVITPPKTTDASQLFLVVAQTQRANNQKESAQSTAMFLVDGNTAGVKIGERHQTIGCRANNIHYVQFDNARLPETCVLGHADEGNVVADAVLKSMRLRSSLVNLGLAKNIFKTISHESIHKKCCGVSIK